MARAGKLCGLALAGMTCCAANAVELNSNWTIVAPEHATPVIRHGYVKSAEILQKDLAEGAGLKLKVAKTAPAEGHAIYLGLAAAEAAGVAPKDLAWYDNVIAEKDGNLYLFGNDRARSEKEPSWEWRRNVLPTVGATVRFLKEYLGDRFGMPGETGRQVGRREKVVVPDGTCAVERPNQVFGGAYHTDIYYSYANNLRGMGLFHTYGGHTYPPAVPAKVYAKDHPEYFAMTRQGSRTLAPTDGQQALCISNPEVEDLIVAEMLKRYDAGADVCQLGQQDGDAHCWCEKCEAMYGCGHDWSEKFWLFHRHLAERIEKLRPGKIVHILSYDLTKAPPKTFKKFPSNVMIELCKYREEDFRLWEGYEVPHGFTVYVYFWGNYPQPGFVGRHSFAFLADNVRRFLRNNVKGIYRCGYGDLFGLEGPAYYVFNHLLDDPEQPVDALVADYCQSMFGAASVSMQQFYDVQDARLRALDKIDEGFTAACGNGLNRYLRAKTKNNGDLHMWAYSPETIKTMENHLAKAEATKGLTDKEKRRLDLVRREFNYAKTMGRIGVLYAAYKLAPTSASFDALGEAILARNAAILGLSDGKGGTIDLPDWPELRLLQGGGYYGGTYWLNGNGRLSATMGAPLNWDVAFMKKKGVLPGLSQKTLRVKRAATAPTLADYAADAGAWGAVEPQALAGVQMDEVPEKTTFKVLCDAENLYLGVTTELPAEATVKAFDPDGMVWSSESLDLYVAPDKSIDVHYHLLWSPLAGSREDYAFGLITDPLNPTYNQADITWNGTWRHEDRREGNTWQSLVTIPFADLGATAPQAGDTWRLNLGRIRIVPGGGAWNGLSLWSPNMETCSFGNPEAMGNLVFE